MEFSFTTLVLQSINFLVLLWILRRFLYRPVTEALAARKAAVEGRWAEAQARMEQAAALKAQCEGRLAAWEQERAAARKQLDEELAAERARQVGALRRELAEERERAAALRERRVQDLARAGEERAVVEGARFVARLLTRLADPALQEGLVRVALQDLAALDEAQRDALVAAAGDLVEVESAFPLPAEARARIEAALRALLGDPRGTGQAALRFTEDPGLLAGLSIRVGARSLSANLRDELRFFSEAAHHES